MNKLSQIKESKLSNEDVDFIEKATSLSSASILKFYSKFLENCPSGILNKHQYGSVIRSILKDNLLKNFTKEEQESVLQTLFELCDSDLNGYIDFKEFLILFLALTDYSNENKLKLIFNLYDKDKSGYLDFHELHTIVKTLMKIKQIPNMRRESENDNEASAEPNYIYDYKARQSSLLTPSYYISFDIMKKFDTNRNAMLCENEFVQGCKNNAHLEQFLILNKFNQ